jgi:glycosyltransferase involved in cell wall biosynthesis
VIEVSIAILFHKEGHLALRSLQSLERMTDRLAKEGISFEVIASLDRPDVKTKKLVLASKQITKVLEVDFGDPALCRNHLVGAATGKYIALLDGDDLWSKNWLAEAYRKAEAGNSNTIWHPSYCYYFFEKDFEVHSYSELAHPSALSHFTKHPESSQLQEGLLTIDNVWSAHSFGNRDVYQRIPFRADSKEQGKGIEDWSFNIESVSKGVAHSVVQGTVHMIRIKEQNSQNAVNSGLGLLPWIPARTAKP